MNTIFEMVQKLLNALHEKGIPEGGPFEDYVVMIHPTTLRRVITEIKATDNLFTLRVTLRGYPIVADEQQPLDEVAVARMNHD